MKSLIITLILSVGGIAFADLKPLPCMGDFGSGMQETFEVENYGKASVSVSPDSVTFARYISGMPRKNVEKSLIRTSLEIQSPIKFSDLELITQTATFGADPKFKTQILSSNFVSGDIDQAVSYKVSPSLNKKRASKVSTELIPGLLAVSTKDNSPPGAPEYEAKFLLCAQSAFAHWAACSEGKCH